MLLVQEFPKEEAALFKAGNVDEARSIARSIADKISGNRGLVKGMSSSQSLSLVLGGLIDSELLSQDYASLSP